MPAVQSGITEDRDQGPALPLGGYLRARRGQLTPADVGLPELGPRRVPGLRREEVAQLARMSVQYYTRLESGRARSPSAAVVDALAAALKLEADALAHLRELARRPAPLGQTVVAGETLRPGVADLVARWRDQPAVVLGRYRDVLAANALAALVNPAFRPGINLLRDTFCNPAARAIYLDWDDVAAGAIAGVRASAVHPAQDQRLAELVRELSAASVEFRTMWQRHDVRHRDAGFKRYCSPTGGLLTLHYEAFSVIGSPGQTLFVFSAAPGSPDEAALGRLNNSLAGAPAACPS